MRGPILVVAACVAAAGAPAGTTMPAAAPVAYRPGGRVLLDAHNAYPDAGRWADRLDRALSTGVPLAIEQDLAFCPDARSGVRRPVVTHETDCHGSEPTLRDHFFERVRPLLDEALRAGPTADWPLVTLNLDFKSNEPEHHAAVWDLLGEHERWLTTAERTATPASPAPLAVGPLLVLTGDHDGQQAAFHDRVPVGGRLRLFGAVHVRAPDDPPRDRPRPAEPGPPDNYRRWWNNPWVVVEAGGQRLAGDWTPQDEARLRELVREARARGVWLRFYTLNGHDETGGRGWTASYNFGSEEAAAVRWRAAAAAGVDFIATDQYEALAGVLAAERGMPAAAPFK